MTEEEVDWNGSGVSTMHAVSQVSGQVEGDDDHKRLVSYFLQSCAAAVVVYKAICFSMIIFHFGWGSPSLLTIEFWPKLK